MSQSAPCSWRQGEAANGVPASEDSHEPAPPASCVRAAWVSQVDVAAWNRNVKKYINTSPSR